MTGQAVVLDPKEPGFWQDPYEQYARIRSDAPVHRLRVGPWVVGRWHDVRTVLKSSAMSVEDRHAPPVARLRDLASRVRSGRAAPYSSCMLLRDPPAHTRLRVATQAAFSSVSHDTFAANARSAVDRLLDLASSSSEPVDLIAAFASPLPLHLISETLGLPDQTGWADLHALTETVSSILDPVAAVTRARQIADAAEELNAVIAEAVAWKRSHPGADPITMLIAAHDRAELDAEELIDSIGLLLLAGHETTINLIGNGVNALLDEPDQLARLHDEPELIGNSIEEILRYDSPVQFSRRIATRPIRVGDVDLQAGDFVLAAIGSANRDSSVFGPDAHRLVVSRETARHHLSFGGGAHTCFGTSLARLQGRIALGELVRRFPRIERSGLPTHRQELVLRGLKSLPVRLLA